MDREAYVEEQLDAGTMDGEAGQAAVLLVLILGLFLLGLFGFAVDLTNVWFHRQAATAAADAACQAGGLDLLMSSTGIAPPAAGFTAGTDGDCSANPAATMCFYARENGYDGAGLNASNTSNDVSWTFPPSVPGVVAGAGTYPFLKVTVAENIKTFFIRLVGGAQVQTIRVSSTCGITSVKAAAPMVVLNPSKAGAFYYSGGGALHILGGPSRGLQVNSTSATAVQWSASGMIDLSAGGPNQTGSDVGVVGGPTSIPSNGSSSGFSGGTTGAWKSNVLPVGDPYGSVPVPASIRSLTPSTTTTGRWVAYKTDGCPDHSGGTGNPAEACKEFGPGYYPSGLNIPNAMDNYMTAIFLPGIYYLNGSLVASGSNTLRMAKPSGYSQTDGVMFYFLSGSVDISGCSGCASSKIDNVPATDLTCDGSSPPAALNMPGTLPGNVLYAQCTTSGTYWDAAGDTPDTVSSTGSRGLLVFQDHADATAPLLTGSGALSFSGALYFHSNSYADVLSLTGGSSTGTFILGEIVADQVSLTGSGVIKLALNPAPTTSISKVALFQ